MTKKDKIKNILKKIGVILLLVFSLWSFLSIITNCKKINTLTVKADSENNYLVDLDNDINGYEMFKNQSNNSFGFLVGNITNIKFNYYVLNDDNVILNYVIFDSSLTFNSSLTSSYQQNLGGELGTFYSFGEGGIILNDNYYFKIKYGNNSNKPNYLYGYQPLYFEIQFLLYDDNDTLITTFINYKYGCNFDYTANYDFVNMGGSWFVNYYEIKLSYIKDLIFNFNNPISEVSLKDSAFSDGFEGGIYEGRRQVVEHPNDYDLYNYSQYLEYGLDQFEEGRQTVSPSLDTSGFKTLMASILNAPYNFLHGVLNFDFMGVNLWGLFSFFITTFIIFGIVKKVILK